MHNVPFSQAIRKASFQMNLETKISPGLIRYVARAILGVSSDDWKNVSENTRKHVTIVARKALHAERNYFKKHAERKATKQTAVDSEKI